MFALRLLQNKKHFGLYRHSLIQMRHNRLVIENSEAEKASQIKKLLHSYSSEAELNLPHKGVIYQKHLKNLKQNISLTDFKRKLGFLRHVNTPVLEVLNNMNTILDEPFKNYQDFYTLCENFNLHPIYFKADFKVESYFNKSLRELKMLNIIPMAFDLDSCLPEILEKLQLTGICYIDLPANESTSLMEIYQQIVRTFFSIKYGKLPQNFLDITIPIFKLDNIHKYYHLFNVTLHYSFPEVLKNIHLLRIDTETVEALYAIRLKKKKGVQRNTLPDRGFVGSFSFRKNIEYQSKIYEINAAPLLIWIEYMNKNSFGDFIPSNAFLNFVIYSEIETFDERLNPIVEKVPKIDEDVKMIIFDIVGHLPLYKHLIDHIYAVDNPIINADLLKDLLIKSTNNLTHEWDPDSLSSEVIFISYIIGSKPTTVIDNFKRRSKKFLDFHNTLLIIDILLANNFSEYQILNGCDIFAFKAESVEWFFKEDLKNNVDLRNEIGWRKDHEAINMIIHLNREEIDSIF